MEHSVSKVVTGNVHEIKSNTFRFGKESSSHNLRESCKFSGRSPSGICSTADTLWLIKIVNGIITVEFG